MSDRIVWAEHPAAFPQPVCEACGLTLGAGVGCPNCAAAIRHTPIPLEPKAQP